MRAMAYGIGEHRTLTVFEFDDTLPIYIVKDNKGVEGCSRKSEKQAIYNYNRNKKRKEEKKKLKNLNKSIDKI